MFCSKCGTKLPDGAKFCASCGSPVEVYTDPVDTPSASNEQIYQSPVIEPVSVPASENDFSANTNESVEEPNFPDNSSETPVQPVFSAAPSETPVQSVFSDAPSETPVQPVFSAAKDEPATEQLFSAVENQSEENTVSANEAEPVINYSSQPVFDTSASFGNNTLENNNSYYSNSNNNSYYSSSSDYYQQPVNAQPVNAAYTNPAFMGGYGNAAPNQQPAYQNAMGLTPDTSQNWGPLMPPKKKSKAPVVIALSVAALLIAVAVVVCCLVFCGKKGGASNAEDALIAVFDAFSDDDSKAALNAMNPLYSALVDALDDFGDTYSSFGLSSDYFISNFIDNSNPKSGGFKYSNLNITDRQTMETSDIESYNKNLSSTFEEEEIYFRAIGIDIGDAEDYMCDAAVSYDGTVKIDGSDYSFTAVIIKVDGSWYVDSLSTY